MTFTINKGYSKSTIRAPRNSAKTSPKLTKTSKRYGRHVMVSLLSNVDRSHTQCNASSIYLEQRFVCRVDVQLIFKNIRRNKRSLLNVNLEKYPKRIHHFVINFKMELFVNFVIDFKLQTIFAKRFILDVSQVEFVFDYNKSNVSYKQQKSYITVFWKADSYYQAGILPVQSQQ